MFGTLIESRGRRQRRTGSSLASIVIHAAIIGGGVAATARHVVVAPPDDPMPVPVTFVQPVEPRPVMSRPRVSSSGLVPAPAAPRLSIPLVIPVGIPSIDLNGTPAIQDWGHGPLVDSRITCDRDCGSAPITGAGGRAVWSASDIMMRLLEDPLPPRYPESLRRAGVEGDVVVKFLVDTAGRVDMRTVEVVRSTHDAFTVAVRETLARLRFSPAMAGERKTNALAVMPFRFTLR